MGLDIGCSAHAVGKPSNQKNCKAIEPDCSLLGEENLDPDSTLLDFMSNI